MVNLFQMNSNIIGISIALVVSLVIILRAALNMVEKKRSFLFVPFFVLGLGVCLTVAFMIYDFFGVAVDVFYIFSFVSVVGMFFTLWRATR